ncbi:EAL domain-containing protein [Escherichia coli]|uniref:EAL domain-containing protein n=1 Tax=Escherichia coli TaxID=562 RepID=UPI0007511DA8|nr:EAL domain-containing protein [Escherichia coli]EFH4869505.1 EAL domain-containing protein [Escherichia coli]EFU9146468.1 EAL domain-containing protein [Escherichia coli]EGK2933008.1 EAL domain-containing protein [Escherichia coli]EHA7813842.1 EAL domain-containing protein [Escherichia coli]EHB7762491.1 EAL domain-containing protein [Escherichia coli]
MDSDFVSTERLMRSLSNGEFEPYLQPVVSASDLTVSGAELLVRWHMPASEIIPPVYFINRVESAGLLLPLTKKILDRAVAKLSEIKAVLPRNFRLAVNVTPTLLAEREFTQMCLALTGYDSIHLVLELTEQQPFNIDRQTEETLGRLSDAGVKLALDDFGTGCSVLSYLKHFPVSYIKMDKSFTQDILSEKTSRHIVESVIGLAGKLGIDMVAEGVETQAQVNCLCSLGVDYLQEFYFGRPEKVDAFCCEYKQRQLCNQ